MHGVGVRFFAQNAATREGGAGWVQNLPDGRVEAFLEGDDEAVTRVERAIRSGPARSRIDKVTVADEQPTVAPKGFPIR